MESDISFLHGKINQVSDKLTNKIARLRGERNHWAEKYRESKSMARRLYEEKGDATQELDGEKARIKEFERALKEQEAAIN